MYERKIISSDKFDKVQLPDVCRYVLVNQFDEESLKQFIVSCSNVLNLGQDFLPILIDSYGGYAETVFGMVDFLGSVEVKVITICESKAMSCGSVLLSCGEERYIGANATTMVHDVSHWYRGKNVEIQNSARETARLDRKVYSILDKNTNHKPGYWKSLVKENKYADLYLNPQKTVLHGLATQIGVPHIETTVSVKCELVA